MAAQLFQQLAQKLAGSAAYSLTERYFAAAATLLDGIGDPADQAMRFAVDAGRHAALYSMGRLAETDTLFAALQARTSNPLDLLDPTCLQIRSLAMRLHLRDATALGLTILAHLGLQAPPGCVVPDEEQRLDALHDWVAADSKLDHSRRPQISDRKLLAIAGVLNQVARAEAYRSDPEAVVWALMESQRMWAEHGPCPDLAASLSRAAVILINRRRDYRGAYEVSRHVLQVSEALGYEPHASQVLSLFSGTACAWFEPLEAASRQAWQAFERLQRLGDLSTSGYIHRSFVNFLLDIGPTLGTLAAEVEAGLALSGRTGSVHAAMLLSCERQLAEALSGQPETAISNGTQLFDESEFIRRVGDSPHVGHTFHVRHALRSLLLGDLAGLVRRVEAEGLLLRAVPGHYTMVHAQLCIGMARAWQIRQAAPTRQPLAQTELQTEQQTELQTQQLAELDTCVDWLAARAVDQPYNFLHLLLLVQAERAWALGDHWQTARTFDTALSEADSRQRPWQRALIAERAGLFHLETGMQHAGRSLLTRSLAQYRAWGAAAKVKAMEQEHPFLRTDAVLAVLAVFADIADTARGRNLVCSHSADVG
jgi:hypothetical protein